MHEKICTSECRIGKSWIALWTFPNNPHRFWNGRHTELISGSWSQPGHIEVSTGNIMVESERVCPIINWGHCDHIAGDSRDASKWRRLPANLCKCGTNIHSPNGNVCRLGGWNCSRECKPSIYLVSLNVLECSLTPYPHTLIPTSYMYVEEKIVMYPLVAHAQLLPSVI